MKFKIGVFGSGGGNIQRCVEDAQEIGYYIARQGAILITGACNGLPHEAAVAAHRGDGLVIGVSPAMNLKEHIEKYQFPFDPFYNLIFTGMGKKGRNIISVRSCDAAIFIGGRTGTLNEFTIAYDEALEEFVIGILTNSGGVSSIISKLPKEIGKESKAVIIEDYQPIFLMEKVFQILVEKKREFFIRQVFET